MERVKASWAWAVERGKERSTWIAAAHAILAASVYPYPWCFMALGMTILQAAMPEAPKAPAA